MDASARDSRLLDLARRLLDGEAIDWDAEGIEESEVLEGMKRLQPMLRMADGTETATGRVVVEKVGDRYIGDFRLVRKLGEGGMGVVYEAEQQHPHRPVALKVSRGGAHVSSETLRLFQREVQTLAHLRHPGIAALYETGATEEGLHYFAMELVRGPTLSEWLRKRRHGPLTPDELQFRLSVFKKICDAVAYAHQRGVIHRDLKPANVLIPKATESSSMQDSVPEVKILDFGLARMTDSDVQATTYVTEMGKVQGTLPYMSPEQVRGNPDEIDLRTDVYSLGVMLYEMVTGKLPYDLSRSQVPEAIRIICDEPPKSISTTFSGTHRLDADVITIAGKCLEKEASRRYQSAAQLGEDVQRYLTDQPILARPPSAGYQVRKLAARHKGKVIFAATVFWLITALAVTSTVQAIRISKERDRANQEAETAKQVSEFLEGLFKVSDPSEARGNAVTAREILDKGAEKIERELRDQPATQARLMRTIGRVYLSLGLYDRAEEIFQDALRLVEAQQGRESLDYAKVLNCLGVADLGRGRVESAMRRHEAALAVRRKLEPEGGRTVAAGLYYVGAAEALMGNVDRALGSLNEALSLLDRPGNDHAHLRIFILNDLALARGMRGERVSEDLRKAYELREKTFPQGHPERILGANNVGWSLMLEGDLAAARPWLERAVDEALRVLGERHPSTSTSLHSLGELERREGKLDSAEAHLKHALAILEASIGEETADVADPLVSLALIDDARGRPQDAIAKLERASRVLERSRGPESPALIVVLEPYATALLHAGRPQDAERARERIEGIRGRSPAGESISSTNLWTGLDL